MSESSTENTIPTVDLTEKRTSINVQEITISKDTDPALVSDVMVASNYAMRGEGFDRGGGKTVILLPTDFFQYKTSTTDDGQREDTNWTLDKIFTHPWVGDYLEGDKTLEGTHWSVLDAQTGQDRSVRLIVPLSQESNDKPDSVTNLAEGIFSVDGMSRYLDGIQRYTDCIGIDVAEEHPQIMNARKLGHVLAKNILPDDNNWFVFTQESKNPKLLGGFNKVRVSSLLGGGKELYGYIKRRHLLRFNLKNLEGEPHIFYKDQIDNTDLYLVADGVSPMVAKRGVDLTKSILPGVLGRFPEDRQPKSVSVLYSEVMKSPRQGAACGEVAVVTVDHYIDGRLEDRSRETLEHEMIHGMMASLYGHSKVSWITEGMAMFLGNSAGKLGEDEFICRFRYHNNEHTFARPLIDVDGISDYKVDDGDFEYKGGCLLVGFIEENYGREFLFDFYKNSCEQEGDGGVDSDAPILKKVVEGMLPISFEDFTENFKEWVREKTEEYSKKYEKAK